MSPVRRTWVPPHSSFEGPIRPSAPCRRTSPRTSSWRLSCAASSMATTLVAARPFRRTRSFTRRSTSRSCSGLRPEVRVVEPQAVGGHLRPGRLRRDRPAAAQRQVQQVGGRVVAADPVAPLRVHLQLDRLADRDFAVNSTSPRCTIRPGTGRCSSVTLTAPCGATMDPVSPPGRPIPRERGLGRRPPRPCPPSGPESAAAPPSPPARRTVAFPAEAS